MSSNKFDKLIAQCEQFRSLASGNGIYYHLTNTVYNVGDQVHPTYRTTNNKTEEFLEKIRLDKYPGKPSRIGCIFVSDAAGILAWKSLRRKYIYQVNCSGNIFTTDGEYFTEIDMAVKAIRDIGKFEPDPDDESEEQLLTKAKDYADTYWQGYEGANWSETIVQGTVQVVKILPLNR